MLIKKRLILITIAYWVFLTYIIVALIFWFIELENQNTQMRNYKLSELVTSDPSFTKKQSVIINEKQRKTTQYISEGATFLALIILGAAFMYRAVRRQFAIQRQQENLMMAITHELKTPIAIAKLNLETLQKHHLDEQKTTAVDRNDLTGNQQAQLTRKQHTCFRATRSRKNIRQGTPEFLRPGKKLHR
jgi:signal transduction histidine kinase